MRTQNNQENVTPMIGYDELWPILIKMAARYTFSDDVEDFAADALLHILEMPETFKNQDVVKNEMEAPHLAAIGCNHARQKRSSARRRQLGLAVSSVPDFSVSSPIDGNDDLGQEIAAIAARLSSKEISLLVTIISHLDDPETNLFAESSGKLVVSRLAQQLGKHRDTVQRRLNHIRTQFIPLVITTRSLA
ncbi:MAG: hypothetical protein GY803_22325 [Chloroflexi bacterium]|nr:hypothetical protein [Chloroflexota bacterium]